MINFFASPQRWKLLINMRFGLSDRSLTILTNLFKSHPGIVKVILYGSRAMGNYRAGSDIDITLVTDESFSNKDLWRLDGELDESSLPYLVDVSMLSELRNENLNDHIKRWGKILYDREAPVEVSGAQL